MLASRFRSMAAWDMHPVVPTAPKRYLSALRETTAEDPNIYVYGHLRVDRACAPAIERLVEQLDEEWLHTLITDAIDGRSGMINAEPLRIECPVDMPGVAGQYQHYTNIVQLSFGSSPTDVHFDEKCAEASPHDILLHELNHALHRQNQPSVFAFDKQMPSAGMWQTYEELRVADEALHPYADRFGLHQKKGYGARPSVNSYFANHILFSCYLPWINH